MPGMAASTKETCELGSPPNAVAAPENSFDCEVTCAWTSMPMTISQSPLAPLMSLDCISAALLDAHPQRAASAAPPVPSCLLDAPPRRHKAAAISSGSVRRNRQPAQALGL